jgi:hypothetical protein
VDKALDIVPVFLDDVVAEAENVKGHVICRGSAQSPGGLAPIMRSDFINVPSFDWPVRSQNGNT